MSVDTITPKEFDYVSTKLREFFKSKGLIETPTQHRLSILAACEDPATVSTFEYTGTTWPLIQSSQIWLEHEILNRTEDVGFYCYTTSYRAEPEPKAGRHDLIFPMYEFEIRGDMEDLVEFEKDLLAHLGYDRSKFHEGNYMDLCEKFGVTELDHDHEQKLYEEYGPVYLLKNFPENTSPFWNMERDNATGLSRKVDVILSGIECFGSAQRSCDTDGMRERFYSISDGLYSKLLFSKFGKERVVQDLENFLKLKFVPRVGCGIGMSRLIRSMRMEGLLPK